MNRSKKSQNNNLGVQLKFLLSQKSKIQSLINIEKKKVKDASSTTIGSSIYSGK